jgi:alkylation response protein AidB-like acyl-CoA dehydrogenase
MEVGREDLGLARLAEAHWDAVAILAEAGQKSEPDVLYGVWASEIPGQAMSLQQDATSYRVHGTKKFCSGAGLVDRALVTVGSPEHRLVEVNLRDGAGEVEIDNSAWQVDAFRNTQTATVAFNGLKISLDALIGGIGWYLERPGFWHGACGPAACWAGGAAGLLDYAMRSARDDAHTLAHLGAMHANVWACEAYLDAAGKEIDAHRADPASAQMRALQVRHLIEQACTDTLRRFARAYGPYPLCMEREVACRYQETELYLRQSHAERDLEGLGRAVSQRIK